MTAMRWHWHHYSRTHKSMRCLLPRSHPGSQVADELDCGENGLTHQCINFSALGHACRHSTSHESSQDNYEARPLLSTLRQLSIILTRSGTSPRPHFKLFATGIIPTHSMMFATCPALYQCSPPLLSNYRGNHLTLNCATSNNIQCRQPIFVCEAQKTYKCECTGKKTRTHSGQLNNRSDHS